MPPRVPPFSLNVAGPIWVRPLYEPVDARGSPPDSTRITCFMASGETPNSEAMLPIDSVRGSRIPAIFLVYSVLVMWLIDGPMTYLLLIIGAYWVCTKPQ